MLKVYEKFGYFIFFSYLCIVERINVMNLFKKLKQHLGGCEHQWVIRYDDREDLDDVKHTFRVTLCRECGKVKSIEEIA
jgi:hypothetical protein